MNYILSILFEKGFYEAFLSGANNRRVILEIPRGISGYSSEFSITLEVWNHEWALCESEEIMLLQEGAPAKVSLMPGLAIHCAHKDMRERFTVVVEENMPEYSDFDKYAFSTGHVTIGRNENNTIVYDHHNRVSGQHASLERGTGDGCVVTDLNSSNGTFVNGRRLRGSEKLSFGDVVYIMGLKLVFLGDILAVNHPPSEAKIKQLAPYDRPKSKTVSVEEDAPEEFYSRSPRQVELIDDEVVEIEAPPNPSRSRRMPLLFTIGPSMTMVIPMVAGVLFTTWSAQRSGGVLTGPFMFMGIVTSVTAAIIGVSWALANYRYSRKMEREDEERRCELYRKYLEKMRRLLTEKHRANKELLDFKYPDISASLQFAINNNRRLWERNVNHQDFLTVRLGEGGMPSPNAVAVPKERFSLIDDDLSEGPQNIKKDFEKLRQVPICISLTEHRLAGVIGRDRKTCNAIAQMMAAQMVACHSYTDVRMAFVYDKRDEEDFAFARWLPHVWTPDGGLRLIANDANSVGEVFYYLSGVVRERTDDRDSAGKSRPLPHYVVFIASPQLVESEAAMKFLSSPQDYMGISTVLVYEQIGRLPNNCTVIIQNDRDYAGYYSLDSSFEGFRKLRFDICSAPELEQFARELSDIRVREIQSLGEIPRMLTFLDMYETSNADDINIERLWLQNRTFESMRAVIGYRGTDSPLYLDIQEKYHGPHGLVAGTTGSGKSETLQTYILSLAVSYHPHEVSFILIDYKGGGMAGSFDGLPHVAGIITNLGGNQTNRALASINSEIKRRQAVFNEYKIKHIDEYIELFRAGKGSLPMPHLLIIADEFAELKKEQPEFVRELVSASRVGRSLGVHLILATQKPGGVVDDEIWGNSKFRLCLRVQDKQDSNDMIKRPDAAYITNAGRGYFQVGNDEIFEQFQSGWSGAPYMPELSYSDSRRTEAKMLSLVGKPQVFGGERKSISKGHQTTQLQAVVARISDVAKAAHITPVDNIWLPPLPQTISLQDIQGYGELAFRNGGYRNLGRALPAFLGLVDDPVNQRQFSFALDIVQEGNLLISSSATGGKSTFLQTLLFSLTTCYPPDMVQVYIADYGSRTMGVFGSLPHVGSIVYDSEPDKTDKLIALLLKELARRKQHFSAKGIGSFKEYFRLFSDTPAIVFAIDNFASFMENCPKQEDNLIVLSREAASYGIYLAVTCTNVGDMRGKIRQNFAFGVGMQLADRFEYEAVIGQRTDMTAEDKIPGRGLVCLPHPLEFQTAVSVAAPDPVAMNAGMARIFGEIAAAWTGVKAPGIPLVPEDLTLDNLLKTSSFAVALENPLFLPFGYDMQSASVVGADLIKTFCYTVSGTPRSGKSNLLRVLMRVAGKKDGEMYVFDSGREFEAFSSETGADRFIADTNGLFELFSKTLVPEFTRRNTIKAEWIKSGRREPEKYAKSLKHIYLFIADLHAFCQAVYTCERDMKGFMEQMVARGDSHMIYLFAATSPSDRTGEYGSTKLFRGFLSWRAGVHLGGDTDHQQVFDFELPMLERAKKLPAGMGHMVMDAETKKIVTAIG